MTRYELALMLTLSGSAVAGCADATADARAAAWQHVISDENHAVAIDTSRLAVDRLYPAHYIVWYRTDHARARLHKGKRFNREVVHSIVRCDSMWFKVISVDMSMNDDRPISRQRTSSAELDEQPWRPVARGTVEEVAALAACHFGARRQKPLTDQR